MRHATQVKKKENSPFQSTRFFLLSEWTKRNLLRHSNKYNEKKKVLLLLLMMVMGVVGSGGGGHTHLNIELTGFRGKKELS